MVSQVQRVTLKRQPNVKRHTIMQIFRHPPESRSREMLAECGLPTSDLESRDFDNFLGCGTPESPKGVVGLEILGSVALLRSLAVAKETRGLGCGKALGAEAENYAKDKGARELYSLTTTAESFFARHGYSRVERNAAPEQIKHTSEFSALCPDRAAFMVKKL